MRERNDARSDPDRPRLDAEERRRSDAVVARLRAFADPDGFVPFDRYMELALYAEGLGVYGRERSPLGTEGDFYTAVHVHPLFGETVAERIRTVRRVLGRDRPFRIVELGPGDGTLAATVLGALSSAPEGTHGLDYLLVERSSRLGRTALEKVESAGRAAGVPVRLSSAAGADGPVRGVVLANEVLDAQPARRLRWNGTVWTELGVRVVDGRVVPAESDRVPPVPSPALDPPPRPGTVLEVSPAAEALVREVADHLVEGEFVAIDYGAEESELVAGHPLGTLAAVHRHRTVDPYEAPGVADLSVFVNFTRVRAAARRAGLEEIAYCSQAEALGFWGLPALVDAAVRAAPSAEAEVRVRLSVKSLLFGFERFRVLELAARPTAEALRRVT